jgi:UDP-sugar transporter A1/2/3
MSGTEIRSRESTSVKNTLHNSESISAVDISALSPNSLLKIRSRSGSDLDADEKHYKEERHKNDDDNTNDSSAPSGITKTGLSVLILLAFQNCSKNLLLRFVMKEHPQFLTSAAVIGVELIKLFLCIAYIILIERQSVYSAVVFIRQDRRNTFLMAVPAALYSIQMTLEYVALGNLDAAVFSVLVQTKLLATAGCAVLILRKKIKKVQLISLVLLTVGVMLCNMKDYNRSSSSVSGGRRLGEEGMDTTKGIIATLSIAACSGFASVYTEKVIKAKRTITSRREEELPLNQLQTPQPQYGLVYTQVQLAFVSLVIMGFYCVIMELEEITQKGLWYGFNFPAYVSIFVSAIGGLTVAAVLKYADAVLKGYATAVSVILTGCLSMILFDTKLNILYFLGIGNVICAVLLYSATDLDRLLC